MKDKTIKFYIYIFGSIIIGCIWLHKLIHGRKYHDDYDYFDYFDYEDFET